jgi:hypothetical protein
MSLDRSLCAICAWRGDCNKKFMQGSGVHCPDYTRDLSIRVKTSKTEKVAVMKDEKGNKKISGFRFL